MGQKMKPDLLRSGIWFGFGLALIVIFFLLHPADAPIMYNSAVLVTGIAGFYCLGCGVITLFDKRPAPDSHANKVNRTAQWAGYASSFFSVSSFVLLIVTSRVRDSIVLEWVFLLMASCVVLATCSGVICLVSGFFEFLRNRQKQNQEAPRPAPLDKPHERH